MRRRLMLMTVVLFAALGLVMGGSPAQAAIGDSASSPSVFSATNDSSGGLTVTHTSATTYTFFAWSYNRTGNSPTAITDVKWVYTYGGAASQQFVYSGSGYHAYNSATWTVPAVDANGDPLLIASIQVGDYTGNPNWSSTYVMYPLP